MFEASGTKGGRWDLHLSFATRFFDTLQRLAVYHGQRVRACSATLRELEHLRISGGFVRRVIQNSAAG